MKAYIIHTEWSDSIHSTEVLKRSIAKCASWIEPHLHPAITNKKEIQKYLKENDIRWNYPWDGMINDFETGLVKKAYPTKNLYARISCAIMHYSLWKKVSEQKEPIFVFEDDAEFVAPLPEEFPFGSKAPIIGLNTPFGATRLPKQFDEWVRNRSKEKLAPTPRIDNEYVPQGLAGNSAYYITPKGGKRMLKLVYRHGLWPNDAIMCRQLVPGMMVTTTYYTKVQGTRSQTTL